MPPKKAKNSKKLKEEDDIPEVEETEMPEETEILDEEEYDDEEEDDEEQEEDLQFLDEDEKEFTIDKAIEEDNEYFENDDDEDIEIQPDTSVEYVKKEERISAPRLTKYEMVRILGERTKQLTMGAKPLIKNFQDLPYDRIAEEELKLNMIPFKIRRPIPNGKYELWNLEELNKEHLLSLLD